MQNSVTAHGVGNKFCRATTPANAPPDKVCSEPLGLLPNGSRRESSRARTPEARTHQAAATGDAAGEQKGQGS